MSGDGGGRAYRLQRGAEWHRIGQTDDGESEARVGSPTSVPFGKQVTAFLHKLGLEQCVQAVIHNGFYTSMEALRGATYEELVDSGVRPGHAKLILGHLSSSGPISPLGSSEGMPATPASAGAGEVASFLRSVGLETCQTALEEAGYGSVEALGRATLKELVDVGIKPVHARLIVSNLDSASTLNSVGLTPAHNRPSFDDEALLGGGVRKRKRPLRLYSLGAAVVLLVLLGIFFGKSGSTPAPSPSASAAPSRGGPGARGARGGHGGRGGGPGKAALAADISSTAAGPVASTSISKPAGASGPSSAASGASDSVTQAAAPKPQPAPGGAPNKLVHHKGGKGKHKGGTGSESTAATVVRQ